MHQFDLVILDLDGTILDLYHHTAISTRVVETIAAVQAAGIPVTIGTGRTLDYVRAHVNHLGITTPVVTTQGAVVGDPVTGRVLHEMDMPLGAAREIAAWIDAEQPVSVFYFSDRAGRTHIIQNRTCDDAAFCDHVFGTPRDLRGSFARLLEADEAHPPLKFISINDPESGVDYAPQLKERFRGRLAITRTHPWLVEGTAQGVDKGHGVRTLCALLGVDPARVLAIGDNDNDIPMLEAVGFGIAMGNATPGVKAAARWVAPAIEDEGAAIALDRWILGRA